VVLGQPVAFETQAFGVLRRAQGNAQRIGHRAALAHGHEVQHGQGDIVQGSHGMILGPRR